MAVSAKTIEKWIDSGEDPDKILTALDELPEDRFTKKLALYYGQYLTVAGIVYGSRELLMQTCSMLVPFSDCMDEPELYFNLALSFCLLEAKGSALTSLKILESLKPGDVRAAPIWEQCLEFVTRPVFSVPACQRYEKAWENFSGPALEFQDSLSRASPSEAHSLPMKEMTSAVRNLVVEAMSEGHLDVAFGVPQSEVTLRCGGNMWLLYASQRLVRSMPSQLRRDWVFTVGAPRGRHVVTKDFDTRPAVRSGVQVWPDTGDCGRVRLQFWSRQLKPGADPDILWALAAWALGEAASLILVENVCVLPRPWPQPGIPLEDLGQVLRDSGYLLPADARELTQSFLLRWERTPVPGQEDFLREDICLCTSRWPALEQQFLTGEHWDLDNLTDTGASAGFLFFPAAENLSDAMKQGEAFSASLLETAGPDFIQMLGVSAGTRRVYVDFIAWDLEPVLKAAETCFARSGCQWGCYHSFFPDGESIVLHGTPDQFPEAPCVADMPRSSALVPTAPETADRPQAAALGTALNTDRPQTSASETKVRADWPQTVTPAKKKTKKKKKGR